MPSDSIVTERDLGRDIDRLADELRTYDHARGLETQDVVDNVRALPISSIDSESNSVSTVTERSPRDARRWDFPSAFTWVQPLSHTFPLVFLLPSPTLLNSLSLLITKVNHFAIVASSSISRIEIRE